MINRLSHLKIELRLHLLACFFVLTGAVLLQCSCVGHQIYNSEPSEYIQELSASESARIGCDLAIIEFDDHGTFWKIDQLDDTIQLINRRNSESEQGVLVVVYTHGWRHNADQSRADGNLAKFKFDLLNIALEQYPPESEDAPSRVIGVYLGWRGDTSSLPIHRELTFWDRKRTAERMVSISMRESLFRVMAATKARADSKCFVVGHSMGGLIIGKTFAPSLTTLILSNGQQGIHLPADLVLLQNPALDGLSSWEFIDFLKRSKAHLKLKSPDGSLRDAPGPIIASITSSADTATGALYTTGQTVGTLTTRFREDYPESKPSQRYLATHTEGHIDYLISHRAWIEDGQIRLERIPNAYNDTPYWIIQASPDVLRDHIDTENPNLRKLISRVSELNSLYSTEVQTWMYSGFGSDQE